MVLLKRFIFFFLLFITIELRCQLITPANYPLQINNGVAMENITGAQTAFGTGMTIFNGEYGPVAMGNGFKFCLAGYCYDSVAIGVTGYIRFIKTGSSFKHSPNYMPTVTALNAKASTGTNGYVKYLLTGVAPNRKFIIDYRVSLFSYATNLSAPYEFQIVLNENGRIDYNYGNTPASWAGTNPSHDKDYTAGFDHNVYSPQPANIVTINTDSTFSASSVTYAATSYIYNREVIPALSQLSFVPLYSKVNKPQANFFNVLSRCVSISIIDTTTNEKYIDIYRTSNGWNFNKFVGRIITNTPGVGQNYVITDTNVAALTSYTYAVLSRNLASVPDTVFLSATTTGPSLSGVKNIPGDYISLTEALEDIRCRRLTGDIYLELNNTYNSGIETFPLEFDSRINAAANRMVHIRPAQGASASIINSGPNPLITIKDFSYLEIDGRPGGTGNTGALAIVNDTTSDNVIKITRQTNNCTFRYCALRGRGRWDGQLQSLVRIDSNNISNIKIDNCSFSPSQAQYWLENGVYANGSNITPNNGNSITNCGFSNFGSRINRTKNNANVINCIDIQKGNTNMTISKNSFYLTDTLKSYFANQVIAVNSPSPYGFRIDSNYFGGSAPMCGGQKMPLYMDGGAFKYIAYSAVNNQSVSICNNTFRNIAFNGANLNGSCCDNFNFIEIANSRAVIDRNVFGDSLQLNSIYYTYPTTGNYSPIDIYFIRSKATYNPLQLQANNNQVFGAQFRSKFNLTAINYSGGGLTGNKVSIQNNTIGCQLDSSVVSYANFNGITGGSGGSDTIIIKNNKIFNVATGYTTYVTQGFGTFCGISLGYYYNYPISSTYTSVIVSDNLIYNFKGMSQSPCSGITCLTNGRALIQNNHIHSLTNVGQARLCGITTGLTLSAYGEYIIKRNFVHTVYSKHINGYVRGIETSMNVTLENNMVALGKDENGNSIASKCDMAGLYVYHRGGRLRILQA